MASIAYPSSATRTNLWTFDQAQDTSTSYKGWPIPGEKRFSKNNESEKEESSKEVLDFAKLENDIIKNVLGEEEKRLEMQKDDSVDIFPSFNYVPPPIPHSFLKSNPILKLYPRDMLTAMNFNSKQIDSTGKTQLNSISTNKTHSDRRFYYRDPLPQIPEVSNNSNSGFQLKSRFEDPFKSLSPTTSTNCASTSNMCYTDATATKTASQQYLYTTPKTTMYNCSPMPEKYNQINFAMAPGDGVETDMHKHAQRNNSQCLGMTRAETTNSHTQPIACSMSCESKRPKVANNQINMICRNFPSAFDDSKRKHAMENVKTFAQIVAATTKPSATATNAKTEYFR